MGGLLVSKDYSRYVGKLWHDHDDLMTGAFPAGGAMAPRGRRSRCGYATGKFAIRPAPVLHPNRPIAPSVGISGPNIPKNTTSNGIYFVAGPRQKRTHQRAKERRKQAKEGKQ